MLCDICRKNEARITYTEVINGEKREQHLCQSCAAEQSSLLLKNRLGSDISIGNILTGLLSNYAKGMIAKHASEPVCLRCGMTVSEFLKTGRLGCPECYSSFATILEKNINAVQNSGQHTGKVPGYAVKIQMKTAAPEEGAQGISHAEEVFREAVAGAGADENLENKDSRQTKDRTAKQNGRTAAAGKKTGDSGMHQAPEGAYRHASPARAMAEKIASMRRELTAAVAEEDYEKAAKLRDGIKKLESMAQQAQGAPADSGRSSETAKAIAADTKKRTGTKSTAVKKTAKKDEDKLADTGKTEKKTGKKPAKKSEKKSEKKSKDKPEKKPEEKSEKKPEKKPDKKPEGSSASKKGSRKNGENS